MENVYYNLDNLVFFIGSIVIWSGFEQGRNRKRKLTDAFLCMRHACKGLGLKSLEAFESWITHVILQPVGMRKYSWKSQLYLLC